MDAGKPDLGEPLILDPMASVFIRCRLHFAFFGPEEGMKRRALVVESQGMARTLHTVIKNTSRQRKRPYPLTDASCHLVDWQAVSRNRVPYADEFNGRNGP